MARVNTTCSRCKHKTSQKVLGSVVLDTSVQRFYTQGCKKCDQKSGRRLRLISIKNTLKNVLLALPRSVWHAIDW
jgi:hypothetical protein